MIAPFQYFGGKRDVADQIWQRLGSPRHYIEPFCGSLAVLLAAPSAASLEVVGDTNGFIANFWRAVKCQPAEVAIAADYPVSHIDLGARHVWLMAQRDRLGVELQDALWPGDARVAGWWLWGQCCWIGPGWCEWDKAAREAADAAVGNAGGGVQALGQIPHISNAGRGVQALGKIPHVSDAGMGDLLTSGGRTAWRSLHEIAARIERVRIVHGSWDRCLNADHGRLETAVFLDPPYRAYEALYGPGSVVVADAVEAWAREHAELRIALCGHVGDYPTLDGWTCEPWTRKRVTYGSDKTRAHEAIWYSPACLGGRQGALDL